MKVAAQREEAQAVVVVAEVARSAAEAAVAAARAEVAPAVGATVVSAAAGAARAAARKAWLEVLMAVAERAAAVPVSKWRYFFSASQGVHLWQSCQARREARA